MYEAMEPLHQTRVHLEDTVKDLTSHLADREQEMIGLREVPGLCSVRVASCLVELWLTSPPPPSFSVSPHTDCVITHLSAGDFQISFRTINTPTPSGQDTSPGRKLQDC